MRPSFLQRHAALIVSLLFMAGMTAIFGWLLDRQHNPNHANISRIVEGGEREVVLERNRFGHYVASGAVNGHPVRFFLDTGATHVTVPAHIASDIGLEPGPAVQAQTANGRVTVYATRLDRVRLGHIVIGNVPASINPAMDDDDILLGMSFLGELELVQRGDVLRLRAPGP